MKKSFTLLEVTIVIVVIGILAAVILPRLQTNKLLTAANQIVDHIRYTQHLAMIDDRFDPRVNYWYKSRWLIRFHNNSAGEWCYLIGSNRNYQNNIDKSETPLDPLTKKHLYSRSDCSQAEVPALLLTKEYGIYNITATGDCWSNNRHIAFDEIGRPYKSTFGSNKYDILKSDCNITFQSNDGNFTVTIAKETGFTYISSFNG
ncbi:prepilin-type N-terminal cleavage/methylation domain-containing protein [Nitratiruptor sp. YY09-18]|uniref:prepilin-type N-terminal cleavage/methylation domain-containing protein n=1 Tax=Nitratiruptor sp. YY09-18 TaxID=2724901 RepID=UPI00191697FB|nr:prepilin-type N-terminal cleavage/methylation domain-containing protein [Nitratiruptor sp. YY09-18]BCD68351.1 hypothetical protein NitYY0918_C1266 [Nitratiruptor sp. YY09-18]